MTCTQTNTTSLPPPLSLVMAAPCTKRVKHLYPVVTDDSVLNGLDTHRNAIIMATPLSNGELVPSSDTDGRNKVMDAHKPPSIKQIATFGSLYNEGAFAVSEQHVIARRRR